MRVADSKLALGTLPDENALRPAFISAAPIGPLEAVQEANHQLEA